MILDIYFRRPIFWDYLLALTVVLALVIISRNSAMVLPVAQDSYSLTGDLTNIALTFIGFVLTILTVLITFKDNSTLNKIEEPETFNKFFSTPYYFETIKHLKNCIKSIAFTAALGFILKIFLNANLRQFLFFYNLLGLTIIMLTVYRCLLILGRILELQRAK